MIAVPLGPSTSRRWSSLTPASDKEDFNSSALTSLPTCQRMIHFQGSTPGDSHTRFQLASICGACMTARVHSLQKRSRISRQHERARLAEHVCGVLQLCSSGSLICSLHKRHF